MTDAERRLLLALARHHRFNLGANQGDWVTDALAKVEQESDVMPTVIPILGPNGWQAENVGVTLAGQIVKLDPTKPATLKSYIYGDASPKSECKHHVPAGVACLECRLEKAERERDDAVSEADRRTREVELSCGVQMRLQRALDHARQALMGIADLAQWHDCQGVGPIARNAIRETDLTDRPVK